MILRPLSFDDADFLTALSGKPSDPRFASQSGWIANQLANNPRTEHFIGLIDDRPVGWFAITRTPEHDEFRWVVAKSERRKGYGTQGAEELLKRSNHPVKIAHIKPSNGPSIRIANRFKLIVLPDGTQNAQSAME